MRVLNARLSLFVSRLHRRAKCFAGPCCLGFQDKDMPGRLGRSSTFSGNVPAFIHQSLRGGSHKRELMPSRQVCALLKVVYMSLDNWGCIVRRERAISALVHCPCEDAGMLPFLTAKKPAGFRSSRCQKSTACKPLLLTFTAFCKTAWTGCSWLVASASAFSFLHVEEMILSHPVQVVEGTETPKVTQKDHQVGSEAGDGKSWAPCLPSKP